MNLVGIFGQTSVKLVKNDVKKENLRKIKDYVENHEGNKLLYTYRHKIWMG